MAKFDPDKIRIREVEVTEDGTPYEIIEESHIEQTHQREQPVRHDSHLRETMRETVNEDWYVYKGKKRKREKKYAPYLFLACLFTGIGITTISSEAIGVMMGLATGFLMFIDPIYDKVMEKISKW